MRSLIESVSTESLIPEYGADGTVRNARIIPARYRAVKYLHDERWSLSVLAANGDSIFQRLMRAIGRPDIADDIRLKHNDGRAAASGELDIFVPGLSVDLTEALDILEEASAPASGINSVAEVFEDSSSWFD